jgi:lipid-binding SYLF domain-containing protein
MRTAWIATTLAALLFVLAPVAMGETTSGDRAMTKVEKKQQQIDKMSSETLKQLLGTSSKAKELYDNAYGYAVFKVVKVAVGITGGGGDGVAVAKQGIDTRTYMRMATGGIGVGLGGQKYRTVFLFEDQDAFDEFVYDGWEADAEAQAAAGNKGANAASSFSNGVAIFQITDKGLLANADVSGTKYWIDEELNQQMKDERTD